MIPATIPKMMNPVLFCVTGSLKMMIPKTAKGTFVKAPTIEQVVGEVADMHQKTENPMQNPRNELAPSDNSSVGFCTSGLCKQAYRSPVHRLQVSMIGVAMRAL
mmetsp:Transcript_12437/g.23820  ORF Transcript_12437/g.23820 Transcript_12437/m.23820 type:complete len:104 (+) Transcript_12437:409-720(+)